MAGRAFAASGDQIRIEDINPCGHCGARPLGVCADLDGHELQNMACSTIEVKLAAGETLLHEGDENPFVFNVTDGTLKLFRLLPDGRRQITGFLYRGDFLGLGARGPASYSAQAVTPVTTCRFRRQNFDRLMTEMPALEHRLVAMAGDELLAAQEQILLLGRKSAKERLASFLVGQQGRQRRLGEPDDVIKLPMTRLDIADYLGLTIETVSRTLSQFRATGVVRLVAIDALTIQKPDELAAMAEAMA